MTVSLAIGGLFKSALEIQIRFEKLPISTSAAILERNLNHPLTAVGGISE